MKGAACWDRVEKVGEDEIVVVTGIVRSCNNDDTWSRCLLSIEKKDDIGKIVSLNNTCRDV